MSALAAPARRFARSVQLERDAQDAANNLRGYIITPLALEILTRLLATLPENAADRAWTLTGPYGSGKSALALFLSDTLSNPGGAGRQLLEQHPEGRGLLPALDNVRLFPLPVTLRRASLGDQLSSALHRTVGRLDPPSAARITGLLESENLHPSVRVISALEELNHALSAHGFTGTLLILDELGKALEYMSRQTSEDVYLLQELAEMTVRAAGGQMLSIGILHQGFEQYGQQLDAVARREWGKVQGRFRDVPFLEPPEQTLRLAATVIAALDQPRDERLRSSIPAIAERLEAEQALPRGLSARNFIGLAGQANPLHPIAFLSLPFLFRRFAQNERSLFAYLTGPEPHAFLQAVAATGRVGLPEVLTYFQVNLSSFLLNQAGARRWTELFEVLERTLKLEEPDRDVIKAAGLLGVLTDSSQLRPTPGLIALALADDPQDGRVLERLDALTARSLLVRRRFDNTYRLWEGSDLDPEELMATGRAKTAVQDGLASSLARLLPERPVVARRHSYEVGALRYFTLRYLDAPPAVLEAPSGAADAILACCLPNSVDDAARFGAWAASPEIAARRDLIIVIPGDIGPLRALAAEARAAQWVWANTPALRDDRVAKRELSVRTAHIERNLRENIERLLDPRPEPLGAGAAYYAAGERQDARTPLEVARLHSSVMDALYPRSPRLWNELINRRVVSSTVASARRALIARMFESADQPLLAMTGFPPERSIYASLLEGAGLHKQRCTC